MLEDIAKAVRSAHLRAKIAIVFLMITMALDGIGAISTFSQIRLLGALARGVTLESGAAKRNDARQALIGGLELLLLFVTAITFLIWMYKAHSSLQRPGARLLEYSPGWTIGSFFIPFYCFVRPYSVMSEIWRASDPNGEGEQSWQWHDPPPILRWWWGFFLMTSLLGRLSGYFVPPEGSADMVNRLLESSYIALVSHLVDIPAAFAAVLAIRSVDARQTVGLRRLLAPSPVLPPNASPEAA